MAPVSMASDLLRLGGSAESQAMANIAGLARDPLAALSSNPAFLSAAGNSQQINFSTIYVDSVFTSSIGERSKAESGPGVIPEAAFSRQLSNSNISWGAGVIVQSAMSADFEFTDPPGTLGASYGRQTHRAEYVVAKIAGAASLQLTPRLALGASMGLAYNRNQLEAPYIFQSHPALAGLKVLVDLDTDDLAATASIGLDLQISETVRVNLAHTLQTDFNAKGELSGNLGQLGLAMSDTFNYDAKVTASLPASSTAGLVWQPTERLRFGYQFDWINWGKAFQSLPIELSNGSNQDLNNFLGENRINDTAPLNWSSQRIHHIGIGLTLANRWEIRGGYENSNSPVPASTATPMTAATLDTALSAGVGIPLGSSRLDVSYRLTSSDRLRISNSILLGGEYTGASQTLTLHTLGVSYRF